MDESIIKQYAIEFRTAIEMARDRGEFENGLFFNHFPKGCCGDTSYLLSEYYKKKGIDTIWYSASRRNMTHAWLVIKDEKVDKVHCNTKESMDSVEIIIDGCDVEKVCECNYPECDSLYYEKENLKDGIIVDITADQFDEYDISVYVGVEDEFHKSFSFINAHDFEDALSTRLLNIFSIIEKYLPSH